MNTCFNKSNIDGSCFMKPISHSLLSHTTSAISRYKSYFSAFMTRASEKTSLCHVCKSYFFSDTSHHSCFWCFFFIFKVFRQCNSSKISPQDSKTVLCHIQTGGYISLGSQTKSISRIFSNIFIIIFF